MIKKAGISYLIIKSLLMKPRFTYTVAAFIFVLVLSSSIPLQAQRGRDRDWRSNNYNNSWRYYPTWGQRFFQIPGPFIHLQFGGNPYYYSGGLFYRPYGSYFEVAAPPFGIHINVLPHGYWPFRYSGYPYYYYNGIFYRQSERDYEVVRAPIGAEVPALPREAKPVVIDGEKFYEYNGTYFKDYIKPNGELWYTVEGKHGVLNTDKNNANNNQPSTNPKTQTTNNKPAIGDVIDNLPADYKTVVINSKKYFVTPDNVYYEEVVDGKQVRYKVAGK